ncbi:hypothetical protein MTO96_021331 [Rhipicephalus appendiculatus]
MAQTPSTCSEFRDESITAAALNVRDSLNPSGFRQLVVAAPSSSRGVKKRRAQHVVACGYVSVSVDKGLTTVCGCGSFRDQKGPNGHPTFARSAGTKATAASRGRLLRETTAPVCVYCPSIGHRKREVSREKSPSGDARCPPQWRRPSKCPAGRNLMHHSVSSGRCATPRAVIRSSPSREADPQRTRNGNNGAQCEPLSIHPLPPRCGTFVAGAPGDFVRPLYAAATRVRLFERAGGARARSLAGARCARIVGSQRPPQKKSVPLVGGRGAAETSSLFLPAVSISRSDHACRMHTAWRSAVVHSLFAVDSVLLTFLWKRSWQGAMAVSFLEGRHSKQN